MHNVLGTGKDSRISPKTVKEHPGIKRVQLKEASSFAHAENPSNIFGTQIQHARTSRRVLLSRTTPETIEKLQVTTGDVQKLGVVTTWPEKN
jgi:uncharacterized protein (DUF2126 family)